MNARKPAKMVHVQEWYGNRHVSNVTRQQQVSYALAKFIKRQAEIDRKYPKGTYFKIE